MTTKTLDLNNVESKLFWTLAVLLGICIMVYTYSISSLTVNVVERDRMSRTAHEIAIKVGDLEQEYLSLQKGVTLAYAQELGFKEVTAKYTSQESPKLSFAR